VDVVEVGAKLGNLDSVLIKAILPHPLERPKLGKRQIPEREFVET
jgi:hypothetical protein